MNDENLESRIAYRNHLLTKWARKYPADAKRVQDAHARVWYFRGDPEEYTCLCGATAEEWQLVILDNWEGKIILPYSEDHWDYAAFCTPCAVDVFERRWEKLLGR